VFEQTDFFKRLYYIYHNCLRIASPEAVWGRTARQAVLFLAVGRARQFLYAHAQHAEFLALGVLARVQKGLE
jgi:hypothetical protein